MNERIQELAEQARFTWVENDKVVTGVVNLEKFAESIVRECEALCYATARGRDAEAIAEAILEHFGVEP